jgi:hypothetical protein
LKILRVRSFSCLYRKTNRYQLRNWQNKRLPCLPQQRSSFVCIEHEIDELFLHVLHTLDLRNTKVSDVSALAACQSLHALGLCTQRRRQYHCSFLPQLTGMNAKHTDTQTGPSPPTQTCITRSSPQIKQMLSSPPTCVVEIRIDELGKCERSADLFIISISFQLSCLLLLL